MVLVEGEHRLVALGGGKGLGLGVLWGRGWGVGAIFGRHLNYNDNLCQS